MRDHYQTLGVPRSADYDTIKEAFKKLALKYHPDKNPGNKHAEEHFKEVTHAYDVLINPEKRARYDLILKYSDVASYYAGKNPDYKPPPRKTRPKPYYHYEDRWTYIKHQLYAFAFVSVVAVFVLTGQAVYEYQKQKEKERLGAIRDARVNAALRDFSAGNYLASLDSIRTLIMDYPGEFFIRDYKRKLLDELIGKGEINYRSGEFSNAAYVFRLAIDYEEKYMLDDRLYFKLSSAYEGMGEYEKAANTLNEVWAKDHENMRLNVELGRLYSELIDDQKMALKYYQNARKRVRDILQSAYGSAYEIVIIPAKLPDIYYDVYFGNAKANFKAGLFEEAVKDCNWAIYFRREKAEGYHLRALTYLKMQNQRKACEDLRDALSYNLKNPDAELIRTCH